jgi:hypothetical protein
MIRRRRASKTEAGFAEGPEYAYRIGPSCVLPEYGTKGFSALLQQALLAVNDEVAHHAGSAKVTILFPMNAAASDATPATSGPPTRRVADSQLMASADTTSAKNQAQRRLMAELGFHQEYVEQVMAYSRSASTTHELGPSNTDETRPDPAGIFASATPGDKA